MKDAWEAITGQCRPEPQPTIPEPDMEDLMEWVDEGWCQATDGCLVEPDGHCPHGHPSWLLKLGWL